ncbi:hypothetical protein AAHA92_09687 [Salvia divinorum]|uniref:Uncharacterized protein n=1 Tax=Salvia divinorum TaxID=28513 RepID=A0ABD1HS62_SALDI
MNHKSIAQDPSEDATWWPSATLRCTISSTQVPPLMGEVARRPTMSSVDANDKKFITSDELRKQTYPTICGKVYNVTD